MRVERRSRTLLVLALCAVPALALAQQAPARPPAVGVVPVMRQPVTLSSEYIGRIQATERVNLVARVAGFLDARSFTEGAEVKKGDPLYRIEQGPYQADVEAKEAGVAQYKAQLRNAELTLTRAKTLLNTPAGQQSTVDAALATQLSTEAQMMGAEAQLEQSKINLGYTDIRAPIDGKIGRTAVTVGNYVTANSGVLATIVSQDPMYVVFPVATRAAISIMESAAAKQGLQSIVVRIRLPDGEMYSRVGTLDFVDNTVAGGTDTITLRAVIPNPKSPNAKGERIARSLVDGELVTAIVEEAEPAEALTIPRAAVLTDQSGDYVFVVGHDDKAEQRRVQLALSTPSPRIAVVTSGLVEGETVVLEGVQRVRPGAPVSPAPASDSAAGGVQSPAGGGAQR